MVKFSDIPNSILLQLINDWIKSERNRRLLKRRFVDGVTLEKLAEEFNLSVTTVRVIIRESEKLLKSKLEQM